MLQSIYTHAGCDYGCLYTYSPRHCFNPHTHAGCDNVHNVSGASFPVSIHTPTQGVTIVYIGKLYHVPVSIHTPTQGVTQAEVWKVWHRSFNPHTHAGCDRRGYVSYLLEEVSIHTPTQGVTMEYFLQYARYRFQSTHPRRV